MSEAWRASYARGAFWFRSVGSSPRSRRVGAASYNLVHGFWGPVPAGAAAWAMGSTLGLRLALIWAAHIGFDRTMGYGLEYATAFKDTHLGRV